MGPIKSASLFFAVLLLIFDLLVALIVIVVARHLFILLSKLVQSFGEFHLIGFSDKFRLKNGGEKKRN